MKRLAALVVAFALLSTIAAAEAETIERLDVGGWDITAYADDEDGQFLGCDASAQYKSDIILGFYIDRTFEFELNLYKRSWNLRRGDEYSITYAIDGGREHRATGSASSEKFVVFNLSQSEFERFQHGNLLKVNAAGGTFFFKLDGSARALQAALDCTQRWVGKESASNSQDPFSGNGATAGAATEDPFSPAPGNGNAKDTSEHQERFSAEAKQLATAFLRAGGVYDFEFFSPDTGNGALDGFDAAWRTGRLVGGLRIVEDATTEDLADAMTTISGSMARWCSGKFASSMPAEHTTPPVLRRLAVACEQEAKKDWEVHYTLFNRRQGGAFLFMVMGFPEDAGGTDVAETDNRIVKAIAAP
jgi:hypothetical protein